MPYVVSCLQVSDFHSHVTSLSLSGATLPHLYLCMLYAQSTEMEQRSFQMTPKRLGTMELEGGNQKVKVKLLTLYVYSKGTWRKAGQRKYIHIHSYCICSHQSLTFWPIGFKWFRVLVVEIRTDVTLLGFPNSKFRCTASLAITAW